MFAEERIKVLIIEDYEIIRIGLRTVLERCPDLEIIAEASSGEQALRLCHQLRPDVVLMDTSLPGLDGIEAIRLIRQQFAGTAVIAFTCMFDAHYMNAILQADAIGYLTKEVAPEELIRAIRAAHLGKPTLVAEAARLLMRAANHPAQFERLTRREQQILRLVASGLTNNEIARHLNLSPYTVKNHVSSLLTKLGVSSRSQAVKYALQQNLVQTD